MKRYQIINKINNKIKAIEKLRAEIIVLKKQNLKFSDKNMQYVEANEEVLISNRPKVYETKLIGRTNFKNTFTDEDTGQKIVIDRSVVVTVNGEFI